MRPLPRLLTSLLLLGGWAAAQSPKSESGRLELGNGVVVEYKTSAYSPKTEGHLGPLFGTDGDIPHTTLKELTLVQGKIKVPLDVSGMYDPWFEKPNPSRFRFRAFDSRNAIITGIFSDAAGSYVAEWLIVDHIGVRILLSKDPLVVREKLRRSM